MIPKKTSIFFIVICCSIAATFLLCTSSQGSTASIEIIASVPLTSYDISAGNITNSSVDITWTTNGPANSTVEYGLNSSYGFSVTNSDIVVSHTISLNGLTAGQVYHYRVVSSDSGGNSTISSDSVFTTLDSGSLTGGSGVAPELSIASGSLIPLTADNLVSRPVAIVSGDRSASLSIAASTRILSKGQPISRISITRIPVKNVPSLQKGSRFTFSGYAYQIQPSGATFSHPPALKITTAPAEWKQVAGIDISIQYYNPVTGYWEPLPTTINQTTHTASTVISHTSDFGLFSRQAAYASPLVTTPTPTPAPRYDQVPAGSIWSIDDLQKSLESLVKKYLISPFQLPSWIYSLGNPDNDINGTHRHEI